jgi:dephospho-CoA kinase
MTTIGITGTIGAGKGTVVEYLKTKGYKHYSVRNFLLTEIKRRRIEPVRESMKDVADDLRKNFSPGYIMEELLAEQKRDGVNGVIESIRALGEIELLRKNAENFHLLAVDATPELRYGRIYARKSTTDNVTYEEFLTYEKTEMSNTEPWKMNLLACIAMADFKLENNGNLDDLHKKIDEVLKAIQS